MFEAQVKEAREKLAAAIVTATKDLDAGIEQLKAVCEEIESGKIVPMESTEYYETVCSANEATADFCVRAQKPQEAEKCLKKMIKASTELVKRDEETYDYLLATAYYKIASLGRVCMNMIRLPQNPVVLDSQQTKVFDTVIAYYKMALKTSLAKAKSGQVRTVELHGSCVDQMALMYGTVGNYKDAIAAAEQSVFLQKAIYEKKDDRANCILLANRMNNLSMLYSKMKQLEKVLETLEDSIYVLEEHEQEDPSNIGLLVGRHCMNLAGAYGANPDEANKAPEMFQKGVSKIEEVNKLKENRCLNDVVMTNFLAGEYFMMAKRPEDAKAYFERTIEAEVLFRELSGSDKLTRFSDQAKKILGK